MKTGAEGDRIFPLTMTSFGKVRLLPENAIYKMGDLAKERGEFISLGRGVPGLPTPQFIVDKLLGEWKREPEVSHYRGGLGRPRLRQLIGERLLRPEGVKVDWEKEILMVSGNAAGLLATLITLLEPGDEVILFDPYYCLYAGQVALAGGKVKWVPFRETESGWRFDFEKLKQAVNKKTKVIILTNPVNPTGMVFSREELEQIAELVLNKKLFLVVDEVYTFLNYSSASPCIISDYQEIKFYSPLRIRELRSRMIYLRSFSKEYRMSGWRIGFVYGPARIVNLIKKVHQTFNICPAHISQKAVEIGLINDKLMEAEIKRLVEFNQEARTEMLVRLKRLDKVFSYYEPEGTFYIFPRLKRTSDDWQFCKELLKETGVVLVPGSGFGARGKGHVRISYAGGKKLISEAFDRMERCFK